MTTTPVKKSRAKERHRVIADHFRAWLEENPKATLVEKVKELDKLADTAKLKELL
jgi:hypothetical protein